MNVPWALEHVQPFRNNTIKILLDEIIIRIPIIQLIYCIN